jgi:hypothetical protein
MNNNCAEYLVCQCCHAHYEGIWAPTQASGCASSVHFHRDKYIIDCEYPSMFDTNRYHIHDESLKQNLKSGALVCDNCIQKFTMLGSIIQDKEYDYWTEMSSNLDIALKEQYGDNYLEKFNDLEVIDSLFEEDLKSNKDDEKSI